MEKRILYVGFNAFPVGLAQVQRQRLIAKGLIHLGYQVTVLNRYGVHNSNSGIEAAGTLDGIDYLYTSGSAIREDSFIKRSILKVKGLLGEISFIFRYFKNSKKDNAILITTNNFHNIVFYAILAKLIGVPSVLDNVEHFSSIKRKKGLANAMNSKLYDGVGFRLVDKVICISDYLADIARQSKPDASVLKIPAIVDFAAFEFVPTEATEPYFLYCGTLSYREVIVFIIEAFEKLENTQRYSLYLVCSGGTAQDLAAVKDRISSSPKSASIKFFTGLPYNDLVNLYMNSKALLIPLRHTDQDRARFPHKIGEYCASSSAIISTKTGEIKSYFTHKVNALLCDNYDPSEFSEQMSFVEDQPEMTKTIGKNGRLLGEKEFDYRTLTKRIAAFIGNT